MFGFLKKSDSPAGPRPSWTERLKAGLSRTRAQLGGLFGRRIDDEMLEELETTLLMADVGVEATQYLLDELKAAVRRDKLETGEQLQQALGEILLRLIAPLEQPLDVSAHKPFIIMIAGVNGSGKTTSIGKLASKLKAQGKSVVLGAGDTFRAAAVQQLEVWGEREGATVVRGKEGADPSAVLFDAVTKAKESGADVVLCDTAGRLQTKTNLMEELAKIRRTIAKAMDGAPHETLLVLDATNGQNAVQQARLFMETIDLTGIILTKLDGTAKGGVILAIADELSLPVRYIGIGERAADLREFDAAEFVEALFSSREALSNEAA